MENGNYNSIVEFPTLITKEYELDRSAIEKNIERLLSKKKKRVLIMGAAGEYGSIPVRMQDDLLGLFAKNTKNAEIIAGILEPSAPKIIERINSIHNKYGFSFAVPVHFHFGVSNFDEIIRQYRAVKTETGAAIYAYDFPSLTRYFITPVRMKEIIERTEVKDIIFSDTNSDCFNPGIKDHGEMLAKTASRAAFLFPEAKLESVCKIEKMFDLDRHPAAVFKYVCFKLGYCETYKLLPPFNDISSEQENEISSALKEINLSGVK